MAKIFSGWKNEKEVLDYFSATSFSPYKLMAAFYDPKSEEGDFTLLFKKGNTVYFIGGTRDGADDHEVANFKNYLVPIELDELDDMFGEFAWYKKNKADVRSYFTMKESFMEMLASS